MQRFSRLLSIAVLLVSTFSQSCAVLDPLNPEFLAKLSANFGNAEQVKAAFQPFTDKQFFKDFLPDGLGADQGVTPGDLDELADLGTMMVLADCGRHLDIPNVDVRTHPTFQFDPQRSHFRCYESATGPRAIILRNIALYLQFVVKTLQWLAWDAMQPESEPHPVVDFAKGFTEDFGLPDGRFVPSEQMPEFILARTTSFINYFWASYCLSKALQLPDTGFALNADQRPETFMRYYWLCQAIQKFCTAVATHKKPITDTDRILCLGNGHTGEGWAAGPAAGLLPLCPHSDVGRVIKDCGSDDTVRKFALSLTQFGPSPFKMPFQSLNTDGSDVFGLFTRERKIWWFRTEATRSLGQGIYRACCSTSCAPLPWKQEEQEVFSRPGSLIDFMCHVLGAGSLDFNPGPQLVESRVSQALKTVPQTEARMFQIQDLLTT